MMIESFVGYFSVQATNGHFTHCRPNPAYRHLTIATDKFSSWEVHRILELTELLFFHTYKICLIVLPAQAFHHALSACNVNEILLSIVHVFCMCVQSATQVRPRFFRRTIITTIPLDGAARPSVRWATISTTWHIAKNASAGVAVNFRSVWLWLNLPIATSSPMAPSIIAWYSAAKVSCFNGALDLIKEIIPFLIPHSSVCQQGKQVSLHGDNKMCLVSAIGETSILLRTTHADNTDYYSCAVMEKNEHLNGSEEAKLTAKFEI
jgi:hypothetical protein